MAGLSSTRVDILFTFAKMRALLGETRLEGAFVCVFFAALRPSQVPNRFLSGPELIMPQLSSVNDDEDSSYCN